MALVLAGGVAVVGCGGGGSDPTSTASNTSTTSTASETTSGTAAKGAPVEVKMADYSFSPSAATAPAGSVTISAPNDGQVEHELVLVKTDLSPAALPRAADGGVDEEKLDQAGAEIGEVADVEPGGSKSGSFKLAPGKYVMFCNLPGHYAQGMYGSFTVK